LFSSAAFAFSSIAFASFAFSSKTAFAFFANSLTLMSNLLDYSFGLNFAALFDEFIDLLLVPFPARLAFLVALIDRFA
jgi:hypothetical protein